MEIDFKSGQTTNIQMIQEKIESLKLEYLSDLQNGIVEFIEKQVDGYVGVNAY